MIISLLSVLCRMNIVFQLAERIAIPKGITESVLGYYVGMLGFSYLAIPTRHEVPSKPYLHDKTNSINPQN